MYVVYSLADLRCLRQARVVPGALLDQIEANLRDVHRIIGDGVTVEDFTMEECGLTAILQPGDGPGAYRLIGLPDAVAETRPEWVGRGDYGGDVVYQVIYLRGNDRAISLFVPVGALDAGTEERLATEAILPAPNPETHTD